MLSERDIRYLDILRKELIPALGCTEPISLAYGAAKCRSVFGEIPETITVKASGNIIKNVKGVVVPNCKGRKGIDTAVTCGMFGGDSTLGLEVLTVIKDDDIKRAVDFIAEGRVSVSVLETTDNLHFTVEMNGNGHRALVEIKGEHTNIVRIEKDDEVIYTKAYTPSVKEADETDDLSVAEIIDFAENIDVDYLRPIIGPQIDINTSICEEGLKHKWGARVGRTIWDLGSDSTSLKAEAMAAAGSDARMSGCSQPVVINSGSGNQGITVSIPVIEYSRENGIPEEKLIRALAISNLLSIHQKSHIGRLSAYCGAVTAACGAGAAITWLCGGSVEKISNTMTNTLATISGMVCDGAKPSCAGKIAVAVNAAFIAHEMSMRDCNYQPGDGIVKDNIEKTVVSVGELASKGMKETDSVILDVMLHD